MTDGVSITCAARAVPARVTALLDEGIAKVRAKVAIGGLRAAS